VISRRASGLRALSLAGLLAKARETDAIDLALGVPPGRPPERLVEGAVNALRAGRHQYVDASGLIELRAEIAAELVRSRGVVVDPGKEITVTCGSTEGTLTALLAVTDPGDEVIVPEPFFENYPGTVELVSAVPRYLRLTGPEWRLDLAALEAAITGRTRAILLNSPHNPTGRVFDEAELTGVMRLCAERGLVCITDEVYEKYTFDGRPHLSPLDLPSAREHAIVLGSLSKSLQISGWRVGYAVAEPGLTTALRRAHERATLGAATPLQHGLAEAGVRGDETGAGHFHERRDQLVTGLRGLGFEVTPPEGGWFVLAGTDGIGWASDELAAKLVTEAGVLVAPATAFFDDVTEGRRWVRFSLVRDERTTAEALDRLGRFLGGR
jgi:aminotransferase